MCGRVCVSLLINPREWTPVSDLMCAQEILTGRTALQCRPSVWLWLSRWCLKEKINQKGVFLFLEAPSAGNYEGVLIAQNKSLTVNHCERGWWEEPNARAALLKTSRTLWRESLIPCVRRHLLFWPRRHINLTQHGCRPKTLGGSKVEHQRKHQRKHLFQ